MLYVRLFYLEQSVLSVVQSPPMSAIVTTFFIHYPTKNMPRALWNGVVVAESDTYELVEGNIYFPSSALKREYFKESSTNTKCPWKGTASYYTLSVNGQENPDAAWFYPKTLPSAKHIEGYIAFWRGVQVEK